MRFLAVFALALPLYAGSSASSLWNELTLKRNQGAGLHQEFEVTRTSKTSHGTQSSKTQIVLDMSHGQWREKSVTGSGNRIKIFDGSDLFTMEEGGDEFIRANRRSKDADPIPSAYLSNDADWSKATEVERRLCGLPGKDHLCAILDVPLKPWTRSSAPNNQTRMLEGSARMMVDTETGVILESRIVESIQTTRSGFVSETGYTLKRYKYGASPEASLFKLPSDGLREVKELSRWNAGKIRKQFKGKTAPELTVTDIKGMPVVLSAFKGKTVLLDFWTTCCPPCRADAPSLDKLYHKYRGQDLTIVGVSVSEDRSIVEDFLKKHPHEFPVVLTSENEFPNAYQIGVFPTYIVIDRDGTVASAVEGDQGFSELRKLLKKAGLELE